MSQPNASYHGKVFTEAFGPIAFIIACRTLGLRDLGPALSPFNAFMILTGIETLPLRMQRHCENALAIARWLKAQPQVSWVSYAGLEDDRYHALQQRYMPKGGGDRKSTSELQSLMRISYAVFCLKKKTHATYVVRVQYT